MNIKKWEQLATLIFVIDEYINDHCSDADNNFSIEEEISMGNTVEHLEKINENIRFILQG